MKLSEFWKSASDAYVEALKDRDSRSGFSLFILTLLLSLFLTIILVVGSSLLPEPAKDQNPSLAINFLWLLGSQMGGNVGQLIQATLGVAATLGGAVVSVIISLSALKLARQAVELTSSEQQREVEKYSRELRRELDKGARTLEDVNRKLMTACASVNACDSIRMLFFSRVVAREFIMKEGGAFFSNETLANVEFEEKLDVSKIIDVLSSLKSTVLSIDREVFFASYKDFLDSPEVAIHIDAPRLQIIDALQELAKYIDEIQQSQFIQYLLEEEFKNKDLSNSLSTMKRIFLSVAGKFQNRESFTQVAAIAMHLSREIDPLPEIDENSSFVDDGFYDNSYEFSCLLLMLKYAGNESLVNLYSNLTYSSQLPIGISSVFAIFTQDIESILRTFRTISLVEGDNIPRPLLHYKPDLYARQQVRSINSAHQQILKNMEKIALELNLDDPNCYAAYERAVDYWVLQANKFLENRVF